MAPESLSRIKDDCVRRFSRHEIWPTFFERRYLEFVSYHELLKPYRMDRVLEIGCGLGYGAALLSRVAGQVTATDLESESPGDHAIGLGRTRQFLSELGIGNVSVVGASAEKLPFPDGSFDLVFSSHVLEHVPDQPAALAEIHRVLAPGGVFFCVTPSRSERAYYFLSHYLYLAKRAGVKLRERFRRAAAGAPDAPGAPALLRSAHSQLRHFPFPPPHGIRAHYLLEWKDWGFARWRRLLTRGHGFELVKQVSTQMSPALILGGSLFPHWAVRSHCATREAELRLGGWPVLKTLGINCVTIVRKERAHEAR